MAPLSTASCVLALSFSAASAIHQGPLKIESDGETMELHVVASSEKGKIFRTIDRTLTMKWGNQTRGFLAKHETDEMKSDMFYNFTLLNKEFSYDVDLSHVGCSCNAALFFVSMPGFNPDGTVAYGQDDNPYYCDANKIGGVWCWEHDTIEANMYNTATTPHTCDNAPGQFIDSCDPVGCAENAFETDPTAMCPDDSCDIDTRKPFRIHQRFEGNWKGQLVRIVNRFVQEGRMFGWETCRNSAYMSQMTKAIGGKMSMVFQLWGDSWEHMDWLDKITGCKGECKTEETEVSFSNIVIRSMPGYEDASNEIIM